MYAPTALPLRAVSEARSYSRQKYLLSLLDTLFLLVLLYLVLATGISAAVTAQIRALCVYPWLVLPLYLAVVSLGYYLFSFPITLYRSFILEHRYGLSRMRFGQWMADQGKSGMIAYLFTLMLVAAFYGIMRVQPGSWWLSVSFCWVFFTLLLAKLTPLIIIPLFFKYRPLEDEELRQRIRALGEKMQVRFLDVFEIDMSKKTQKANAAFVGWGATRRVLLADTLRDRYTHDEISVILAHEFAHYKYKHLLKLIIFNAGLTMALFYLIFRTAPGVLASFGLDSLSGPEALPLLFLYMHLFNIIIQPAHAFLSRCLERTADRTALAVTGLPQAFISMMKKLARQNLADMQPHPLVKFFFFDHPPVSERIHMAQAFGEGQ